MKVYAFVDIHANSACAKKIVKKSKNADVLVCAGDISDFTQGLSKIARILAKANKTILTIHGNHEEAVDIDSIAKRFPFVVNIHGKVYRIGDIVFIGFGGGGFSFRDNRMEKFFHGIKKRIKPTDKVILVTHAPAYGKSVDHIPGGGHRGCLSVNRGIKMFKPVCAIAGHLHETAGNFDKIGKTIVLNPGRTGVMLEI